MNESLEDLARRAAAGDRAAAEALVPRLQEVLKLLKADVRQKVIWSVLGLKECDIFPPDGPLTPELLDWARQQYSEEELVAALRELRTQGGLELHNFIQELEQIVAES
jgi:hypothetical protein